MNAIRSLQSPGLLLCDMRAKITVCKGKTTQTIERQERDCAQRCPTYHGPCLALRGSDSLLGVAKGGAWPGFFVFNANSDKIDSMIS